ncbi:MAG: sodium:calcium antiporter, partial [Thermoplasmata archaeon]|nr:sodium:calcium antiporter [Thermoplasmata archaeon]
VIGSNIVNLGIVLGLSCIVGKIAVSIDLTFLFFIFASFLITMIAWKKLYSRMIGVTFLIFYAIFLFLLYL